MTDVSFTWSDNFALANPLKDEDGIALFDAGGGNGNGALYQIGYFNGLDPGVDPATVGSGLWDLFVPLSGDGSQNPTVVNTIGDLDFPSSAFPGFVSYTSTFDSTLGHTLPAAGQRLGVRLFNGGDLASSTYYNTVTSFNSSWLLPAPQTPPFSPTGTGVLDLDVAVPAGQAIWEGGALETSERISVRWADTGTDWSLAGSWDNSFGGTAPPSTADVAKFPEDSTITFQPDLAGTNQSIRGMIIDNTGADYAIRDSGAGSLTIGVEGVVASGGGTAVIGVDGNEVDLVLGGDQIWEIGTGTTLSYADIDNTFDFGNNTITKTGAGTLNLNEDNFANIGATSDIVVEAGTLHLAGDPGTTSFMVEFRTATVEVMGTTLAIDRVAGHNGILEVNSVLNGTIAGDGNTTVKKFGTGSATINSTIAGAGQIIMNDSGDTIQLTANNTYSGATTVTAGTLLIDGDQSGATGAVLVDGSGTLGGTGTVGGATTMNAGGQLAPGTAGTTGTLAFANGLDSSDATWLIDINSLVDLDVVDVTGNLDLSSATLNITGTPAALNHVIGSYSGSLTGTFSSVTPGWQVDYDYLGLGQIAVSEAALVPEPSTIVPLAALLLPWVLGRRRRA